jgi:hypothetical protein
MIPYRCEEAFRILRKYNPLRNDLDAYLYAICLWGEGEEPLKPIPEHFGVEPEEGGGK